MAEVMNGVVDVLADFQMSFTTARELVVEGMRHLGEFLLIDQVMRDAAEVLHRAVIEVVPHDLAEADAEEALAEANLVGEMLFRFVPLRVAMWTIDWPLGFRMSLGLIHQ